MSDRSSLPSRSPLSRAKPLGRAHTAGLLGKLGRIWHPSEWALFTEVRNTTGVADVLRRADALAVHLTQPVDGFQIVGFEVKSSRADLLREFRRPEKSSPLQAFCAAYWLVLPAPAKRILLSLDLEVPDRWGVLEVGTGDPVILRQAVERKAEEPTPGFIKSLLRAALGKASDHDEAATVEAPLSRITRTISRFQVGLMCGHVAPAPMEKKKPIAIPCFSCAAGLPGDRALIKQAIREASSEERAEYYALLDELEGKNSCGCRDRDPVFCLNGSVLAMGISSERAAELAIQKSCGCPCHAGGAT